jgi:hypothetical protein
LDQFWIHAENAKIGIEDFSGVALKDVGDRVVPDDRVGYLIAVDEQPEDLLEESFVLVDVDTIELEMDIEGVVVVVVDLVFEGICKAVLAPYCIDFEICHSKPTNHSYCCNYFEGH